MPPKGKKGGKKSDKGKKDDKTDDGEDSTAPAPAIVTEKELLLQEEYTQLCDELEVLKNRIDDLRTENDFLQGEAHKIRIESHEYMSYMEKKTSKRQSTIISLSDQNQKEIEDIKAEKQQMLKDFEDKKAALRAIVMEKENILAKTRQDIAELQEYKNLQQEQISRIKDLEKDVIATRGLHTEAMQKLKANFLKEKREFHSESEQKIVTMAKQANKEAFDCLTQHTNQIKEENTRLRHELLGLIRKSHALAEHKTQLEQQQRVLLMEEQYAQDLRQLKLAKKTGHHGAS